MPRQWKANDIEDEAQLQAAMKAFLSKEIESLRAAANHYKVSRSTLTACLNGRQPRNKAHESEQILTHPEEKELVWWITQLTSVGYPPRYITVKEMAEEIRKRCVISINSADIELVSYSPIGQLWVSRMGT